MNKLTRHVLQMTNTELNGLAKNRFLPVDLQMAIARTGYKVARDHLSYNPGLDETVRDYLWNDQPRAYVLKAQMIMAGHYINQPEKYIELYDRFPALWRYCHYRPMSTFIGGYSWYGEGSKSSPTVVLNMCYEDYLDPKEHPPAPHSAYGRRHGLKHLAAHSNCDLKLAIKLSTCGISEVEKLAFQKIVELS